jgi:hypothetical protein
MKLVAQSDVREDLPAGEYTARLKEVKTLPPSELHPDWGSSLAWEYEVLQGPKAGQRGTAFTPCVLKSQNGLGVLMRSMLGRAFAAGEEFDADALIGKCFKIFVDFNKSGSRTRVMRAIPVADPELVSNVTSAQAPAYTPGPRTAPAPTNELGHSAPRRPAVASPAAPVAKVPVFTAADFKRQSLFAFVQIGQDPATHEMQVSAIRQLVVSGTSPSEINCYIPDTASWLTLTAVDMPF